MPRAPSSRAMRAPRSPTARVTRSRKSATSLRRSDTSPRMSAISPRSSPRSRVTSARTPDTAWWVNVPIPSTATSSVAPTAATSIVSRLIPAHSFEGLRQYSTGPSAGSPPPGSLRGAAHKTKSDWPGRSLSEIRSFSLHTGAKASQSATCRSCARQPRQSPRIRSGLDRSGGVCAESNTHPVPTPTRVEQCEKTNFDRSEASWETHGGTSRKSTISFLNLRSARVLG